MKVVSSIRKVLSTRFAQIAGKAIVLCFLAAVFAACAVPPPPVFQSSAQAAGKIACDRSPAKAIAAFPRMENEDGYFVYEARIPSQRDDGRQRIIRVKLPEGLSGNGMEDIQPVEICPLTRRGAGSCADTFQSMDVPDLHSMAGRQVTELFRFEVVDLSKLKGGLGKGVLPKDALLGSFAPPIELWIEFYKADKDLLAETGGSVSPLGEGIPGIGYWSCVDKDFTWKEFKNVRVEESNDQTFLVITAGGWDDPAVGMQP